MEMRKKWARVIQGVLPKRYFGMSSEVETSLAAKNS
jgi:hypothetical protein